jgi:hypothetical protein
MPHNASVLGASESTAQEWLDLTGQTFPTNQKGPNSTIYHRRMDEIKGRFIYQSKRPLPPSSNVILLAPILQIVEYKLLNIQIVEEQTHTTRRDRPTESINQPMPLFISKISAFSKIKNVKNAKNAFASTTSPCPRAKTTKKPTFCNALQTVIDR